MSQQTKKPMRGPMGVPGGGHGMMPGEKPKDFKKAGKTLLGYARPFRFVIIAVTLFALLSTLFNILAPLYLGRITTSLFQSVQSKTAIDFAFITRTILILLGLYLFSCLFTYLQNYFMAGVTQKITYRLRHEISLKINRLPLKYYDSESQGDILSRITNDVDTIGSSLQQSILQVLTSAATVIGVVVMMLVISPLMTVTALLILPVTLLSVKKIVKKSQGYFSRQQNALGQLNGHVEEMYAGHNIVKAFCGEEDSVRQFRQGNDQLYQASWRALFLSGLMMPIVNLVGNLGYVAVCVLGGYLAIRGSVNVGAIQAFIQYVRQFNQPISQLAQIANVFQSTLAASERVFVFLEEPDEIPETSQPVHLDRPQGAVRFDHVHFGYNPDREIIKDFSADVKPGQRIAIVGPTGAGKTTLLNLLLRFYDVDSGAITIDGVDVRDMKRKDLRDLFGMVLQDAWLFTGTIRENIAYGKPGATDEEIYQAADAACVHHFIQTLPEAYNMVIDEDVTNISQGQRQLITIARAILADNPIMILDEATSSVDTRTEVLIQQAMQRLMENRTSFIIAHRLSTIRDADLILVLNDGNIVEQGTHEQLLAKGGFYANLYNSQFAEAV